MSAEPKLEAYLNTLDKSLSQIPISDRAEIIMEIKSHILDSQANSPDLSMTSILDSLGEAETVANRYLLERGLKVSKPPKTPMVKWLTIGFLGTLSILVAFLTLILWKFTPIISVDNENDHVVILGGLIDINGQSGKMRVGARSRKFDHSNLSTLDGSKEISKSTRKILFNFSNGSFQFTWIPGQRELKWQCQSGGASSPPITQDSENLIVDFQKLAGAFCKIQLPGSIQSHIQGSNGHVELLNPRSELELKLNNGQIVVSPVPQLEYNYQIQLVHGHADHFVSSNSSKAIKIAIHLSNGYVERLDNSEDRK